ncbi:MAG: hypothetical protein AAGI46_05165 [Planctomycetota bacterium]
MKEVAVSQYPRGGAGDNHLMGYAFRTDRYRLVLWRDMDARNLGETSGPIVDVELYDYEADPLETRNVASDPEYAEVRQKLEALAETIPHTGRP